MIIEDKPRQLLSMPIKHEPNPDYPQDGSMEYGTHPLDGEFMSFYAAALKATGMQDNTWRRPRFFQMLQMFAISRGVDGATAEAGCFRGLASHLICQYRQKESPAFRGGEHWMIDSFEGLSPPIDVDGEFAQRRFNEGAFAGATLKRCRKTMMDFPDVEIVKGWIPQVFDQIPGQKYRFVHIDVDVYQPTLDSLRHFFPQLNSGGIIVVDDYGPWPEGNWPGCAQAVKQFAAENNLSFAKLDTGNAVFIRR